MHSKHRVIVSSILLALGLVAPAVASAQDATVSAEAGPVYERGGISGLGLVAGLKGAVGFGQVFNSTELGWIGELELGWVTPYRPVQIFATGSYVRTGRDGEPDADGRLPGDGSWAYDLVQDQLIITLGGLYRFPLASDLFRPYGALGARAYMTRTEITSDAAGENFGTYREEGTNWGGYAALGGDLFVGPGSVLFEVQAGWAPIDRFVLQDTSTGMLNIAVGYRIFL